MQRWWSVGGATVVAAAMVACGSATPTPPIAVGDPCAVITTAQVGAILGTPVGTAEREGATCSFSTVHRGEVGNDDPAESPPPNVALQGAAITLAQGTADALSGGRPHFGFKPQPLTIPGADLPFRMWGPHMAVLYAQRGHAALKVVVFRGWTDDAYLAGRLAGAILPRLPAA